MNDAGSFKDGFQIWSYHFFSPTDYVFAFSFHHIASLDRLCLSSSLSITISPLLYLLYISLFISSASVKGRNGEINCVADHNKFDSLIMCESSETAFTSRFCSRHFIFNDFMFIWINCGRFTSITLRVPKCRRRPVQFGVVRYWLSVLIPEHYFFEAHRKKLETYSIKNAF
jgi:hypothetical protein